jgi:hypothetical protein
MSHKITILSLDLAFGGQSCAKTAKTGLCPDPDKLKPVSCEAQYGVLQTLLGVGAAHRTDGRLYLAINTKYGGQGKGIT